MEYKLIEKNRIEFQKVLNQWKHIGTVKVIWMEYSENIQRYRALIKITEGSDNQK